MSGNKGIVIQERDRHLLREIAVMRVIDREQAKTVAGFKSTTRANVRLLALTQAGLLRRFFIGTANGGKKSLYALSLSGAALVQAPYRGPRRKKDEFLVADFFVSHQLRVNEIHCLVKYEPIPVPGSEFHCWVAFQEHIERGASLIPDGYLEMYSPAKTLAAFLEVDLGHEGHSVWKAKVQEYLRYALSGHFTEQFHEPQFRVLVAATSERRMQSLRTATAPITEKLFWFTTFDSIERNGFWSAIWLRPTGDQRQRLL